MTSLRKTSLRKKSLRKKSLRKTSLRKKSLRKKSLRKKSLRDGSKWDDMMAAKKKEEGEKKDAARLRREADLKESVGSAKKNAEEKLATKTDDSEEKERLRIEQENLEKKLRLRREDAEKTLFKREGKEKKAAEVSTLGSGVFNFLTGGGGGGGGGEGRDDIKPLDDDRLKKFRGDFYHGDFTEKNNARILRNMKGKKTLDIEKQKNTLEDIKKKIDTMDKAVVNKVNEHNINEKLLNSLLLYNFAVQDKQITENPERTSLRLTEIHKLVDLGNLEKRLLESEYVNLLSLIQENHIDEYDKSNPIDEKDYENFTQIDNEGAGDCLFHSIKDCLLERSLNSKSIRAECIKHIKANKVKYTQFFPSIYDKNIENYIERMQKDGEWGDELMIRVISEVYDITINVYVHIGTEYYVLIFNPDKTQQINIAGIYNIHFMALQKKE